MRRLDDDKVLGALLGLAVGDALGAPVDGLSGEEIGGAHDEFRAGGPHAVRAGQGTADTELALRLATSIVEFGGFEPDYTLRAYVGWVANDPPGVSEHMREVLGQLAGGHDPQRVTSGVHLNGVVTSGNGALARTTPIGIAFACDRDLLRDATLADAALTHFDPLAGKAALLHNQVISWLLTSGSHRVFEELRDASWLDDRIEDVVVPATCGVLGYAEALACSEPGSALASLSIGLAALLNAEDFEGGLRWAVNLGGDADSNGAVAGALLGARLGASAIPARWVEPLERRAEIEALAPHLAAIAG